MQAKMYIFVLTFILLGQHSIAPNIRPQESEQVFAVINESPYFCGLNWIINTLDNGINFRKLKNHD